jgi:hypothetical protein
MVTGIPRSPIVTDNVGYEKIPPHAGEIKKVIIKPSINALFIIRKNPI